MKQKVIAWRNLPLRMPILFTGLLYLLLDHWSASGVVYGICITILLIWWVVVLYQTFDPKTEHVDIFKKEDKNDTT